LPRNKLIVITQN